jgi:hypothetical protein
MTSTGEAPGGARRPHIFCIGLNKTGTSSLHTALEMLGYTSLHWGGRPSSIAVHRASKHGMPLLAYLGDYDAYSDIQSLSLRFDELDEQYPGSKFILTTRDLDGWLDSRRRHVERNQVNREKGTYTGQFLVVDYDAWTAQYRDHHARVRAYFADRPRDLLEMDITTGAGWDVLCPFLEIPVPSEPFPWKLKDSEVHG